MYKILITTSGTGSRLGHLTRNLNKALIPIARKPAISYIIEQFPKDCEFILTTGYLSDQVRSEVPKLHPDLNIKFVEVDKFEGHGSSLAYSMLQAKNMLQAPFIFCSCDTLVRGREIPPPTNNWIGGFEQSGNSDHYRTIESETALVTKINEKGEGNSNTVLIGIFGIKNYQSYWKKLEEIYGENPNDSSLNDTSPFNSLIKNGLRFDLVNFPVWLDTGNPTALERTKKYLEGV